MQTIEATETASTTQGRFKAVNKILRKQGVKVRTNVRECCRGCVGADKLGMTEEQLETMPYAWTYGGQGRAITWFDGEPFEKQTVSRWGDPFQPAESVFFNHGNGAAPLVVGAFEAFGFEVVWDGNDFSCVEVKFA